MFNSDSTGPIDWSKVTVTDSTVTDGTVSPKKNLFSNELRMEVAIDGFAMLQHGQDMVEQAAIRIARDLRASVGAETKCANCERRTLNVQQQSDLRSDRVIVRGVARCKTATDGNTHCLCPNNEVVSRTLSPRTVEWPTNIKWQEKEESPPSFPSKIDEPYIRNDPDKPNTKGGDVPW